MLLLKPPLFFARVTASSNLALFTVNQIPRDLSVFVDVIGPASRRGLEEVDPNHDNDRERQSNFSKLLEGSFFYFLNWFNLGVGRPWHRRYRRRMRKRGLLWHYYNSSPSCHTSLMYTSLRHSVLDGDIIWYHRQAQISYPSQLTPLCPHFRTGFNKFSISMKTYIDLNNDS